MCLGLKGLLEYRRRITLRAIREVYIQIKEVERTGPRKGGNQSQVVLLQ